MHLRLFFAILVKISPIVVLGQEETTSPLTISSTLVTSTPTASLTLVTSTPTASPTLVTSTPTASSPLTTSTSTASLEPAVSMLATVSPAPTSYSLSGRSTSTVSHGIQTPQNLFICWKLLSCPWHPHHHCHCPQYAHICYGPYTKLVCPNGVHNGNQKISLKPWG
ncbi:hypothetical protein LOAG_00781 [Loa loa]|uniref:WAP domain-containing protein n=1 Tax=Loa loa TaxID=7209 RepID=A0A1I7VQV0_LOALO|nr:hypothetical protein LOAG_00781 [Loa loa]EFO27706.1 hypothetical protein LOAG_00781 [Loa loa]